jgi:hypothetical protein
MDNDILQILSILLHSLPIQCDSRFQEGDLSQDRMRVPKLTDGVHQWFWSEEHRAVSRSDEFASGTYLDTERHRNAFEWARRGCACKVNQDIVVFFGFCCDPPLPHDNTVGADGDVLRLV